MSPAERVALRRLAEAATPGPWRWYGDVLVNRIYLATTSGGRRFVMDFKRWGMTGAQPRFQVNGVMRTIKELARREAPYRGDIANVEHPDAHYIAEANPTAVLSLLGDVEQIERQTQRRMIAALYWRAGATMVLAARAESRRQHAKCDRLCNAAAGAFSAAQAMEAACAR